ncbi:MAG: hypothetical protein EBU08_21020, partial [Micrococcales bacterium]|nr:hypothetical protein [Micrococcales bacterium]
DILNELASTTSRYNKEAILTREKNNGLLKAVFVAALDPMINYHIRKIPQYESGLHNIGGLEIALKMLDDLSSRMFTGHAAIFHLSTILSGVNQGDADVIERIINKDVRCGVSIKTVNFIWPGLISEYPVMLCDQYNEKTIERIKFPALCQLKLDGMRFNAICKNGAVELRTRNGKVIDIGGELDEMFATMADGHDVVFDGELLVYDEDMYQYLPRQASNGIMSRALKGTITKQQCTQIAATVWDRIDGPAFREKRSTTKYIDRFNHLAADVERLGSPRIKLVWSTAVVSVNEAIALFEQFLAEGQEGVILKDMFGPWESKRVKHQLKFKGELECDLVVVDWELGTGKNQNRLGALVAESADGDLRVSIGSGFTDADRDTITRDAVGKIVSVKYNGKIKDKKSGKQSLFLPIFVELRADK